MSPTDDSDIEDLLTSKSGDAGVETAPLNLDHLTKGTLDVGNARRGMSPNVCDVASAHCSYFCYAYPCTCSFLTFVGIAFSLFLFLETVTNPTEYFGYIKSENLGVDTQLTTRDVDHWCLKGDNDSCRCDDPLEPISRMEFRTWLLAHKANKELIESYKGSDLLDVAFLGESLVEEMDGRWMGKKQEGTLTSIAKSFDKNFKRQYSGIEGVALGVAGDTSPNVLWRLLHGEMPEDFNPRVWWIMLGMNDIGRMQCSEEVVVLGILRVVEEIHKQKPDAKIVINSMLPMADLRGGAYPLLGDYKDAFRGRASGTQTTAYVKRPEDRPKTPTIKYKRPQTTTKVLEKRHNKGKFPKITADTFKKADLVPKGEKKVAEKPAEPKEGKKEEKPEEPKKDDEAKKEEKPAESKKDDEAKKEEKPTESKKDDEAKKEEKPAESKKDDEEKKEEKPAESKKDDEEKKAEEKVASKADDKDAKDDDAKDDEIRRLLKKKKAETKSDADRDALTKSQIKAIKKYEKKIKKDPINPKLYADRTKIKKRDPKKMFLKQTRLPLWTSITAINKELRKFASKHEYVTFFDATGIFTERVEGNKFVLKSSHTSIRGHPTERGFKEWEEKISEKLTKMLKEQDEKLEKEAEQDAAEAAKGGE